MEIETHTVAIWKGKATDGNAPPHLMDALKVFGRSRATRLVIRLGEKNSIKCVLRVPLLRDFRVCADELGRALRKVLRAAMNAGKAGDEFMIELYVGADSQLVVRAIRNAASRGPKSGA